MSKYVIDSSTLTSIANAVREKGGTTEAIKVSDIPAKIYSINGGGYAPTDEDLTFKDNSYYLFGDDNYNWLIKNFADRINCGTQRAYTFYNCRNLREIPSSIFKNNNIGIALYNFSYCYILDKIQDIDLNTYKGGVSITSPFNGCSCLRDIVFKTNNDGTPYVYNNNIYFDKIEITNVGYVPYSTGEQYSLVLNKFGSEKRVTDATSYQALKNDPDWWTTDIAYSKYNHDSAVRTLNSLPDVSISGSGSGTIKFTGNAGRATDAGAINTLTSSEIAVATAKGWTVTYA